MKDMYGQDTARLASDYEAPAVADYGGLAEMTQACYGALVPPQLGVVPILSEAACP